MRARASDPLPQVRPDERHAARTHQSFRNQLNNMTSFIGRPGQWGSRGENPDTVSGSQPEPPDDEHDQCQPAEVDQQFDIHPLSGER